MVSYPLKIEVSAVRVRLSPSPGRDPAGFLARGNTARSRRAERGGALTSCRSRLRFVLAPEVQLERRDLAQGTLVFDPTAISSLPLKISATVKPKPGRYYGLNGGASPQPQRGT